MFVLVDSMGMNVKEIIPEQQNFPVNVKINSLTSSCTEGSHYNKYGEIKVCLLSKQKISFNTC